MSPKNRELLVFVEYVMLSFPIDSIAVSLNPKIVSLSYRKIAKLLVRLLLKRPSVWDIKEVTNHELLLDFSLSEYEFWLEWLYLARRRR